MRSTLAAFSVGALLSLQLYPAPLPIGADHNLDVLRGLIPGHSMVEIEGHDLSLTTTRTTVVPSITTENLDQSGIDIDATPAKVKVASTDTDDTSAGAGVRTVHIHGLDALGAPQTETITMNGQTEVESTLIYSAITGIVSLTAGATLYNEGVVWVGIGSFTAGVPATKYFAMGIQQNKGLSAYYVVPAGTTFYIRQVAFAVATTNKDVDFFVEESPDGSFWRTEAVFGMEPGEWAFSTPGLAGLPAGTHLRVEAKSSASGTDVSVVIVGELVDN